MDFMKLKASLALDSSEYEGGLSKAEGKAKGFGGKWKAAMGVFKVGAAAVGTATLAVAGFTKKSVDAFAEFQQLEGGVKKLYGSAADEIMNYANNAFKTSGMSANQYMEQATSFSAALINSLGGDTSAAAKQTDVAMKAIADNFNTFGGDIGMVQGAFQGFAKQNYTMLDNLKLGYGGTKTEMERLIADANEFAAANGKAADLSIDSFSDIVTAIDLIQEKQGIRGATEAEANKTIEGSMMALKGAWQNLVAGFANPDADIGALVTDVMDRAGIAAKNLGPAIFQALEGIGEAFSTILPELVEGLPGALETYGMPLIQTGAGLVKSLIDGLVSAAPNIVSTAIKLVGDLLMGLAQAIPSLVVSGINLVTGLIQGLNQGDGNILEKAFQIIQTLAMGLINALPEILAAGWELIKALGEAFLNYNWLSLGVTAFKALGNGIKQAVPAILSVARSMVRSVVSALGFSGAAAKARAAFDNIKKAISDKIDAAKDKVKKVIETIKGYFPFNIGKVFSGWVPKISLKTNKSGDKASTSSSTSRENFAKAMNNPYLFKRDTLVNQYAGHAWGGGEIMYGKNNLMNDIRDAVAGNGGDININLNYEASDDATDMLKDLARGVKRYRMAGVM